MATQEEAVEIDFLWVVDNSSSMCQKQVALTDAFNGFIESIQEALDIEPRIAVTTVDVQCDVDDSRIFSSKGKFNQRAAKTWPPVAECLPSPPDTVGCPEVLPSYLTTSNLDLFRCIATVGINQEKCLTFEQPLRAGLMALDPNGPNADQARDFLRDDAWLVVVFVSDEDDCSIKEGATIGEDYYETCYSLATTDAGGPLVPVGQYVNRFKTLKNDPSRVIVAAISTDSSTRLLEFIDGFGENGLFSNIASVELGLAGIGKLVVDRVKPL